MIVAYSVHSPMTEVEFEARVAGATQHVETLIADSVEVHRVGDLSSGFIAWTAQNRPTTWRPVVSDADEGAFWLHIPAGAGSPDDGVDTLGLARSVSYGQLHAVELGAPCAVVHWMDGELRVTNDVLGLARLYAFELPGFGHVWTSRPGLGHVFAGVAPTVSERAWAGMATLGWSALGASHLGDGRQIPPCSSITVAQNRQPVIRDGLEEWVSGVLEGPAPSPRRAAEGMAASLARVRWWPQPPIADLSGGKDSRVTAAAAIRAGVVDTVRTVNTDSGEVETAKYLMSMVSSSIEHRIDEVATPESAGASLAERYQSLQRAWEGAYNARSAYRAPRFHGFRSPRAPRINGLGGEAMQGKTLLSGKWQEALVGADQTVGLKRVEAIVRAGTGASTDAVSVVVDEIHEYADLAERLGLKTGYSVVDCFYNFSKMPYWSLPLAQDAALLPYFNPRMLEVIAWSIYSPSEYGALHREYLQSLMPEWSDIPFYKPSPKTRSTPWMWENLDWPEVRESILEGGSGQWSFDKTKIEALVKEVEAGQGANKHETALSRVIWEQSFKKRVQHVCGEARHVAARVTSAAQFK